jgi:hypothetical protein
VLNHNLEIDYYLGTMPGAEISLREFDQHYANSMLRGIRRGHDRSRRLPLTGSHSRELPAILNNERHVCFACR